MKSDGNSFSRGSDSMGDYVFLIFGSLVTIICFYFIVAPFFKRDEYHENKIKHEQDMSIESIYAAVNELEMDYLMKKITETDFQIMKNRCQMMAAEFLKVEEQHIRHETTGTAKVDQDIFMELQKIRKKKGRQAV
jgi:hypothetical protein